MKKKKGIAGNLLSVLVAGVIVALIVLLSRNTDLFESFDGFHTNVVITGHVILNIIMALALVICVSNTCRNQG